MAASAPNVTTNAENSGKKEETKTARFRWNQGDKVSDLIQCLAQYKSTMECNNSDFFSRQSKTIRAPYQQQPPMPHQLIPSYQYV